MFVCVCVFWGGAEAAVALDSEACAQLTHTHTRSHPGHRAGLLWLADVGFGGQGLLEPLPVVAFDDQQGVSAAAAAYADAFGSAAGGGWCPAAGESAQAGGRFRLRRGVMGSAEPLPAAAAACHPEAESHVSPFAVVVKVCIRHSQYAACRPMMPSVSNVMASIPAQS